MGQIPHLLLQLTIILVTARGLALLLQRFGQPPVIGEMLAGLALGPILFGALAPDLHASLFPPGSICPGGLQMNRFPNRNSNRYHPAPSAAA